MHVCIIYTKLYVRMHVYMYVCMYVHMYPCTYSMHACTYVCMHACMFAYMRMCSVRGDIVRSLYLLSFVLCSNFVLCCSLYSAVAICCYHCCCLDANTIVHIIVIVCCIFLKIVYNYYNHKYNYVFDSNDLLHQKLSSCNSQMLDMNVKKLK